MALRLKGSYGLALLFTTGIVGWMATGETVFSGQQNENTTPPPAVRNHQADEETVRVAIRTFTAQKRENTLTIRGRTEADTKVSVRVRDHCDRPRAVRQERRIRSEGHPALPSGCWVTRGKPRQIRGSSGSGRIRSQRQGNTGQKGLCFRDADRPPSRQKRTRLWPM